MTETLETLSSLNQTLDVEYFHRVLHFTDKAIIAAPLRVGEDPGDCCLYCSTLLGWRLVRRRTQSPTRRDADPISPNYSSA